MQRVRRGFHRAAVVFIAAAGLSFVAVEVFGATIINGLSADDVYRRTAALAYGEHPRQVLDLYAPAGDTSAAPVLLFFHGGGWTEGSRGDYEFVASSFAREGYLVVLPDYRLHPEVVFPGFVDDAAAAATWVQEHAQEHGGDPGRIFLAGHSAGAYLAAHVALWPEKMLAAGGDPEGFAGLVGLAGPYDFLPLDEDSILQDVFPEATRLQSQPIHHVDAGAVVPPVLLVHGTADERVWPRNSRRLAAALERRGADVTLITYEGVGHVRLAASLAPPLDFLSRARRDVLDWLSARRR
ncbi:MAG: alpha/beta hydrolase [Planctomycetota bacterium]|nr:alpha/beta hydrolase [Planctomycetota bacterium]